MWNEEARETELAYKIVQECEEGYDYSIMDENYREIDGGVYDNPDVDIRYALLDIVDDLVSHPDTNGAKGNISSDAKWEQLDFDAEIIGVIISGSRCRGLEGKNSDLDVVVQLSGNEREDDLFNLLHEDKFRIGGVVVDINPITEYKTGTLEEYLPGVEKYLEEKALQKGKKPSVTADLQSKKMQVAGEKKMESHRENKKNETVI